MQVSKSLQYAVLVAVAVLLVVEPRMARAVPPAFNPSCPTPIPSAATFNNLVPDVTDVPLPVTVSLQPIQITDIDAKAQTYGLSAYLFMSWQDSRLAFNATDCNRGKDRYVLTGTRLSVIWRPQIEFPNARSRTVSPEEVNVYQDGFCLYVGRIQLVLNAEINVMMFPFDEHDLRFTMREFDLPSEELVLIADIGNSVMTVRESSQFTFEPTMAITHSTFTAPARNKTNLKQLTFTFHARRMYLATLFNNLLPVFFITSVGVFSFYLPRAVSSASQTIITTTAFLAAMAFSVTLQSTLPAVRYLTRANILVIISYTINFLSFCFAVVTGALSTKVDAIYKAEDALRAKAAEQAAKAAAPRASTGPEQAGDAAAAARGEVELTATLPGQLRTPLAVSAGAAGAAGAPAPPTVGGMMGAVVAMDVGAGAEAGAGATGRQGLYVADPPALADKNLINGKQLVPRRRRKQLLASYFGVLCKCHSADEPLAVRLQSLADTISFVARIIVPPVYALTAILLFNL